MRTIESLVEAHRLATERKSQGLPIWAYTVDVSAVFHNDDLDFVARRDRIAEILRRSKWFTDEDESSELHEIVDNIADSEDVDEFDNWWECLYDCADYARAWIKTQ